MSLNNQRRRQWFARLELATAEETAYFIGTRPASAVNAQLRHNMAIADGTATPWRPPPPDRRPEVDYSLELFDAEDITPKMLRKAVKPYYVVKPDGTRFKHHRIDNRWAAGTVVLHCGQPPSAWRRRRNRRDPSLYWQQIDLERFDAIELVYAYNLDD